MYIQSCEISRESLLLRNDSENTLKVRYNLRMEVSLSTDDKTEQCTI